MSNTNNQATGDEVTEAEDKRVVSLVAEQLGAWLRKYETGPTETQA